MTTAVVSQQQVTPSYSKTLNIALWVSQVLLALAFGMAGLMKSTQPIAELAKQLPWVASAPGLTRFIGVSDLLGALGLLLPAATRIKPSLTPLAALGLVVVMVLATGFHVIHGEFGKVALTVVLGGLASFIAWGRFKKVPIAAR